MTTLVTGAFGCIGSWVVRGLLADGERPVVYDLGDDPWRMRMIAGDDVASRVTLAPRMEVVGRHRGGEARRFRHLGEGQQPAGRVQLVAGVKPDARHHAPAEQTRYQRGATRATVWYRLAP